MKLQNQIFDGIKELFRDFTVISISGSAGTGKTSLTLCLVGSIITSITPFKDTCIWVQASEQFPIRRLKTLFRNDGEKLDYLISNIFVIPNLGPYSTYEKQIGQLRKFSENDFLFPPDIRFIVIDNISHHLRFKISQVTDLAQRSHVINGFYENVLNPLIFRCQREEINLILIHEATFDVESQHTRPFFFKLYERIKGVNISLSSLLNIPLRKMEMTFGNLSLSFDYTLTDEGFIFFK
ncbi:MAG: hypothetical protein ACFFE4_05720 [Candidatus Thorarchaeota archaeon]